MEHVGRRHHELRRVQTDALAVVVNSVADLNEDLLQRGLRQRSGSRKLVGEGPVDDRVVGRDKRLAVAASIGAVERAVKHVGSERLLRLDQGLGEMLGVGLADTDVITVLDENLRQREGKAIDLVLVALDEEHTTGLVGDCRAIGKLRSRTEAEQNRLFVVVAGNATLLAEDLLPLVSALIVNAVERLVEDGFDNGPEVRTAHWCCHDGSSLSEGVDRGDVLMLGDLHLHDCISIARGIINAVSNTDDSHLSVARRGLGASSEGGNRIAQAVAGSSGAEVILVANIGLRERTISLDLVNEIRVHGVVGDDLSRSRARGPAGGDHRTLGARGEILATGEEADESITSSGGLESAVGAHLDRLARVEVSGISGQDCALHFTNDPGGAVSRPETEGSIGRRHLRFLLLGEGTPYSKIGLGAASRRLDIPSSSTMRVLLLRARASIESMSDVTFSSSRSGASWCASLMIR